MASRTSRSETSGAIPQSSKVVTAILGLRSSTE
jgi:hypothetical protein